MEWIWTTLLLAIISYIFHELLWMKKRRRLPPGPKPLPILGNLHLLGRHLHKDLFRLSKKYGPIMYMQMGFVPTIVVSSPEAAEKFLKTHDLNFSNRPYSEAFWYVAYEQRDLSFTQYGPYWQNMRKLCAVELLSNNRINQFQSMRSEQLGYLIESLKESASNNVAVNLSASVSSMVANMSCLMIFGKKYSDEDFDERGFKDVIQEFVSVTGTTNLSEFFPFLAFLDLQGLTRRLKALGKKFDGFLEKILDEHIETKNSKNKTKDFVDTMMAILQSGEADFEFDRRHIKAVLLDMLLAQIETSVTAVEWILTELLKNPNVMKKLQNQLEEKVGLGRTLEESDIEGLEYLDMVIKETFRVHPVVPLLPRESIEDCTIDGFHIPKKSRILINAMAIAMDSNVWKDPERFLPERFADNPIDICGSDFRLIPFGSGRRTCPAKYLGLAIIRLVVAQLVHCFDWELPNGMKAADLNMTEALGLAVSREDHLAVVPSYRLLK